MWEPSSAWSAVHSAASSSGKRAVKRRRTVRGVSPLRTSSSKRREPVPSPPTCFVTHVVTSIWARLVFSNSRLAFGCTSPSGLRLTRHAAALPLLLPVEVLLEPAEVERAQEIALRPAGLAVVVDRLVPAVDHVAPLLADLVVLGPAGERVRAV